MPIGHPMLRKRALIVAAGAVLSVSLIFHSFATSSLPNPAGNAEHLAANLKQVPSSPVLADHTYKLVGLSLEKAGNAQEQAGNSPEQSGIAPEQADLQELGQEEKETLRQLNVLQVEIAEDESKRRKLEEDSVLLQKERLELDSRISAETAKRDADRKNVREILVRYEMAGPGSQMELLLDSENLSMFLQRLSILREMNAQTEAYLTRLDVICRTLAAQEAEKVALLADLDEKRTAINRALVGKQALEAELEASLSGLAEKRALFEARLEQMRQGWDSAKTLYPKLSQGFSDIVAEGAFPPDVPVMEFSLTGMVAVLKQAPFQQILSGDARMLGVRFRFQRDLVILELPELDLILEGSFDVKEGKTLEFQAVSGSQKDFPLEPSQLKELELGGPLQFRLEPVLQGGTIRKVASKEGELRLDISFRLFP